MGSANLSCHVFVSSYNCHLYSKNSGHASYIQIMINLLKSDNKTDTKDFQYSNTSLGQSIYILFNPW